MTTDQDFLKELDKNLWTAADKLRSNLDAAVYKHAVLGLIFLKYVSDSFDIRQQEVEAKLRDKNDDYFLDPADFDTDGSNHRRRNQSPSASWTRAPGNGLSQVFGLRSSS